MIRIDHHGVPLDLLGDRAVLDPATETLFVADVHVGKDESLRAAGMPIPPGASSADLERLRTLVDSVAAKRLVILGDFLHARAGRTPEVDRGLRAWRAGVERLEVTLVIGNHDRSAGLPHPDLGIRVVPEGTDVGPLRLVHDPDCAHPPTDTPPPPTLAGHIHPAVRLGPGVRPPVFWMRGRTLVLPAFSEFTAGVRITPSTSDRCWAVADGEVVPLPTGAGRRSRR